MRFLVMAAEQPPVTVVSPCECLDAHGKGRWAGKTDSSLPPADARAVQAVVPSDMFSWPGIDVSLTWQSERTGIEKKWFALTGRVVPVKVETDSDLHIAVQDATGDKPGIVVCEVPANLCDGDCAHTFSERIPIRAIVSDVSSLGSNPLCVSPMRRSFAEGISIIRKNINSIRTGDMNFSQPSDTTTLSLMPLRAREA